MTAAMAVTAISSSSRLYSLRQRFGLSYDASASSISLSDCNFGSSNYLGWYSDGSSTPTTSAGAINLTNGRQIDHSVVVCGGSSLTDVATVKSLYQNQTGWFGKNNIWQIGHQLGVDCYNAAGTSSTIQNFQTSTYATDYYNWAKELKSLNSASKLMAGTVADRATQTVSYSTTSFLKDAICDYYESYGRAMPIDVFNLSITVNQGEDALTVVRNSARTFRQWMESVDLAEGVTCDYGESELWITVGYVNQKGTLSSSEQNKLAKLINWLANSDGTSDVVDETLGMADDGGRLVQRWSWSPMVESASTQTLKNIPVFDDAGEPTTWGSYYISQIPTHNPEPMSLMLMGSGAGIFFQRRR
jgi:hypothetical protein